MFSYFSFSFFLIFSTKRWLNLSRIKKHKNDWTKQKIQFLVLCCWCWCSIWDTFFFYLFSFINCRFHSETFLFSIFGEAFHQSKNAWIYFDAFNLTFYFSTWIICYISFYLLKLNELEFCGNQRERKKFGGNLIKTFLFRFSNVWMFLTLKLNEKKWMKMKEKILKMGILDGNTISN